MGKSFLFIMRHTPYDGVFALESLDMLFTTAAFDQKVAALFLDDGVFQLLRGQRHQGRKPLGWGAANLYDVDDLFVEQESLQEKGVSQAQLIVPTRTVARDAVAGLLAGYDVLVNC